MIKLKSLIEWKKYSVSHSDPDVIKSRKSIYEPWKGPHSGAETNLLITGKKPAAIINLPQDIKQLWPYIKSGKLIAKNFDNEWIVGQPTEEYRLNKIIKLKKSDWKKSKKSQLLYHAKLGILLGYSKDDIKKFLQKNKIL